MLKDKKLIISITMGVYFGLVSSPVEWLWYNYLLFFIISSISSIILYKFINYLDNLQIKKSKKNNPTKKSYIFWAIYIFVIMLIALIAYHPIQFTEDLENQYQQVLTGIYQDWHPIIHTMIFYRLPMFIYKSRLACALFHMLFVECILLYFCRNLDRYGFNKYIITVILSLFILNPTFDHMAIAPVKDSAYSYCLFLLTILLVNAYFTDGNNLNKNKNFLCFLFACFGITFFRHNGVGAFVLSLIPMIFIYKNIRKKIVLVLIIILSLRFLIVPYIYKACDIKKTTFTFSETVCIMLGQISYIYNNNGTITEEQLNTLSKMQSLDDLKNYYDPYNYNRVKFSGDYYNTWSPYINSHKKEFLKLWYSLVMNNKKQAVEGYLYATYCIWHISLNHLSNLMDMTWVMLTGNDKINNYNYRQFQSGFFTIKGALCYPPFSIIFITSNVALFAILFMLLYGIYKVKDKLKLLVVYLPIITNLAMILVMLPGREGRFMYPQLLCSFPLIIFTILLSQKKRLSKEVL